MITYSKTDLGIKYKNIRQVDITYYIDDLSLDVSEDGNDDISRIGIYCKENCKCFNFGDIKFVVHWCSVIIWNVRIRGIHLRLFLRKV